MCVVKPNLPAPWFTICTKYDICCHVRRPTAKHKFKITLHEIPFCCKLCCLCVILYVFTCVSEERTPSFFWVNENVKVAIPFELFLLDYTLLSWSVSLYTSQLHTFSPSLLWQIRKAESLAKNCSQRIEVLNYFVACWLQVCMMWNCVMLNYTYLLTQLIT